MKASIIIPVWNGREYLPDCLDALLAQEFPHFEVIVVDNASTDGSADFIAEHYPQVRVIRNERNLGFAGGCNVGIRASRGEYAILLNSDTAPLQDWLSNLVSVADSNPQAGMVTARIRLFYDQLLLRLKTTAFQPKTDDRVLGVQVFDIENHVIPRGVVQYLKGFYDWEISPKGQPFRWTKGNALLGIPVPRINQDWSLILTVAAPRLHSRAVRLSVFARDHLLSAWDLVGTSPMQYKITIPAYMRSWARPLIQNAGSWIFWDGSGRDRGTYVRGFEIFYEEDEGQYDKLEEVAAGCGASLLLRKAMLEDVGLFDEDFFMYYEDTDLSLRAQSRGWKILYAPHAIIRHIHCGSSQEWSPFFVYHVDRNRLAMLFKNGLPRQVWQGWWTYMVNALSNVMRAGVDWIRRREWQERIRRALIQVRVIGTLLLWLPKLWRKRRRIQQRGLVTSSEITSWFKE